MTKKRTVAEVNRQLQSALGSLGFKKNSPQSCCLVVSQDVQGWVGFNQAKEESVIEPGPVFGVHCVPIHRLIAEVRGEKYKLCELPRS